MKNLYLSIMTTVAIMSSPCYVNACGGGCYQNNLMDSVPVLPSNGYENIEPLEFEVIRNVAQQKDADWSHVVGVAHNISPENAKALASSLPEVTFFFYAYHPMWLEIGGNMMEGRMIYPGDAVFFSGEPTWGDAYATGYIKK